VAFIRGLLQPSKFVFLKKSSISGARHGALLRVEPLTLSKKAI